MSTSALEPTQAELVGRLSQAALVQVLRALFVGRLTGRLSLGRDDESLGLRFVSGYVVSACSGPVAGRLGEIIVKSGVLSRADLDAALDEAAREGRRLGPVLVERRVTSRAQIDEALRLQVRGVLLTALFWRRGTFRFEPDDGATSPLEEVSLRLSTAALILEVINAIDQPPAIRQALGNLDRRLVAADDPRIRLEGVTLSPGDAFVLSRADGTLTARQILETTPLPQETLERSLLSLLSVGVVEWSTATVTRSAANPNQTLALSREAVRAALEAHLETENERRLRDIDTTFATLLGKTHHDVLGLPSGATAEEVREAYKRLTKRFHPDAVGKLPSEQSARGRAVFMRISEAYNALRVSPRRVASCPAEPVAAAATPVAAPALATAPVPPARAEDPRESLSKAKDALAARPWEALATAERLLDQTSGALRQEARLLKAWAQLRSPGSWRAGELALREILQESPESVDALVALGSFYKDRGLAARASTMFRKVLEIEPAHRRALREVRDIPRPETGPMRFTSRFAAAGA
jgi:hypothetical protein